MSRRLLDRPLVAIPLSLVVAAAVFASARASAETRVAGAPIPGRYIVVMHDDTSTRPLAARAATAAARIDAVVATHGARPQRQFRHGVRGFSAALSDAQVQALRRDVRVKHVEPDRWVRVSQAATVPWGIDRLDQRSLPLSGSYTPPNAGSGVSAYVVDTGIRATHAEFGGRVQPGFGVAGGDGRTDCNGHGTHVAGILGGVSVGVARGVSLVPVQVMDCGGFGMTSDIVAGIDWVTANHRKPAVANLSLGGLGDSPSMREAVRNAVAAGVTMVVAAGNTPADACELSPAGERAAITVGATSADDRRAWWSASGSCVDLFAPGVDILSSTADSDTSYAAWSGTSMAAPHVAGVAALWLSRHPTLAPRDLANALSASAVSDILRGHLAGSNEMPFEFLEAGVGTPNRLVQIGSLALPATRPPVARIDASCSGLTCRFDASASTDDVGIVDYLWRVEGRGVLRGRSVDVTFLGPVTTDVTLIVTDTERQTDLVRIAQTVTGTPADAPCSSCAFESGIVPLGTGALLGPQTGAIRVEKDAWLTGWLAKPYAGEGLPQGIYQKLSLHRWDGSEWKELQLVEGWSRALTLRRFVGEGWYAWRMETGPSAHHYVLWHRMELPRRLERPVLEAFPAGGPD